MVVPAVCVWAPRRRRCSGGAVGVELERRRDCPAGVSGLVAASAADGGAAAVRPRVGQLRAGSDARGRVAASVLHGDRVVVPGVRVRAAAGSTLPALSAQEPLTAALPVSGPEYVFCAVQEAIPDVPSVPPKETVTGWSYQPFASGPRPSVAEASGAVESYASGNAAVPRL